MLALLLSLILVAAACGDDDDTEAADDSETTTGDEGDGGECPEADTALDEDNGTNSGQFKADLMCADNSPLKAEGDPIVIGFQNPEGDPAGTFPEFSLAAEAAVKYINDELGGLGSDPANGKPGRPIKLEICKTQINPADSQRCANEIAAQDAALAISSINFFGNHIPVYEAAGIPVVVATPVTMADFTGNVFAIGGGGGCVGVHTGMVEFATSEFEDMQKVGVPWADTPPGVVCYYDLEAKALDVLRGEVDSGSERAGELPDLEYIGVPVRPATPDMTPQMTEVLGFDPDVLLFSAQGADCWNLVDALGRLGWNPQDTPLVMSGACIDFEAMEAAGDLANGIYFVGARGSLTNDPETIDDEFQRFEAEIYQEKASEYGLPDDQLTKGFATQGWNALMSVWELSADLGRSGDEITSDTLGQAFAETDGHHSFGSTPLACKQAIAPYKAVCNSTVTASQWDGTNLVPLREGYSGVELVAGTELKPGP